MSLGIAGTWRPTSFEWNDIWHSCAYATYFHGGEWAKIWETYSGGTTVPDPVGIVFSDGTRVVLPFSKQTVLKGYASRWVSSPAGTFGGWIGRSHLTSTHQAVLAKWIAASYPDLIWRLNPYEPLTAAVPGARVNTDETHCLDLSVGFDEIYRGWSKGHGSAARKARKARDAGVVIKLAENEEDWRNYFRVYNASQQRWGARATSAYDWSLFEAIFKRASPHVRLWLAIHERCIVAGALCFYSAAHAVYWHGAALSDYFRLRPVNLLMQEAIRDACARSIRWFDFNPSGGLEGVKAFKRSFNAFPLSSNVVTTSSLRMRLLLAAASLLPRKKK